MARGKSHRSRSRLARRPQAPRAFSTPQECHELAITRIVTAKGLEVDLAYEWEIDDGIREGWVVHRLVATVGGVAAGYLKVSYVPSKLARVYFPDPFHYALWYTGSHLVIRHLVERTPDEAAWTADDLRAAIESSLGWVSVGEQRRLGGLSAADLRVEWQRAKARIEERYADEYEDFLDFHLDKPLVDYIRVERGPERYEEHDGVVTWIGSDDGFQRQGIGTALYEVGAAWMAANGLTLWASGLQSPEAEAAWRHLESIHAISSIEQPARGSRPARTRRFLDGSQIRLEALTTA